MNVSLRWPKQLVGVRHADEGSILSPLNDLLNSPLNVSFRSEKMLRKLSMTEAGLGLAQRAVWPNARNQADACPRLFSRC